MPAPVDQATKEGVAVISMTVNAEGDLVHDNQVIEAEEFASDFLHNDQVTKAEESDGDFLHNDQVTKAEEFAMPENQVANTPVDEFEAMYAEPTHAIPAEMVSECLAQEDASLQKEALLSDDVAPENILEESQLQPDLQKDQAPEIKTVTKYVVDNCDPMTLREIIQHCAAEKPSQMSIRLMGGIASSATVNIHDSESSNTQETLKSIAIQELVDDHDKYSETINRVLGDHNNADPIILINGGEKLISGHAELIRCLLDRRPKIGVHILDAAEILVPETVEEAVSTEISASGEESATNEPSDDQIGPISEARPPTEEYGAPVSPIYDADQGQGCDPPSPSYMPSSPSYSPASPSYSPAWPAQKKALVDSKKPFSSKKAQVLLRLANKSKEAPQTTGKSDNTVEMAKQRLKASIDSYTARLLKNKASTGEAAPAETISSRPAETTSSDDPSPLHQEESRLLRRSTPVRAAASSAMSRISPWNVESPESEKTIGGSSGDSVHDDGAAEDDRVSEDDNSSFDDDASEDSINLDPKSVSETALGIKKDVAHTVEDLKDRPEAMKVYTQLTEILSTNGSTVKPTVHQLVGAAILCAQGGNDDLAARLCADEPGTGKTVTMLLITIYFTWSQSNTDKTVLKRFKPVESENSALPETDELVGDKMPCLIVVPNLSIAEQTRNMAVNLGYKPERIFVAHSGTKVDGVDDDGDIVKSNWDGIIPMSETDLVIATISRITSKDFQLCPYYISKDLTVDWHITWMLCLGDGPDEDYFTAMKKKASLVWPKKKSEKLLDHLESYSRYIAKRKEMRLNEMSSIMPCHRGPYIDGKGLYAAVVVDEIHLPCAYNQGTMGSKNNETIRTIDLSRIQKVNMQALMALFKLTQNPYGFTGTPFVNCVEDAMIIMAALGKKNRTGDCVSLLLRTKASVSSQLSEAGLSTNELCIEHYPVHLVSKEDEVKVQGAEQNMLDALNKRREELSRGTATRGTFSAVTRAMREIMNVNIDTEAFVSGLQTLILDHCRNNAELMQSNPGAVSRPCVIAAEYHEHMDLIERVIRGLFRQIGVKRIAFYHGKISLADRQTILKEYNDGAIDFLILGMKAGSVGINLQIPNPLTFVVAWFPWNGCNLSQLIARVARPGAKVDVCTVHWLYVINTASAWTRRAIDKKDAVNNALLDEKYNYGDQVAKMKDMSALRNLSALIRELKQFPMARRLHRATIGASIPLVDTDETIHERFNTSRETDAKEKEAKKMEKEAKKMEKEAKKRKAEDDGNQAPKKKHKKEDGSAAAERKDSDDDDDMMLVD